jgi:hypothetical protein
MSAPRKFCPHIALAGLLLAAAPFFAQARPPTAVQSAESWPQADRLFHVDPHWLGGDAAFSVDLGHGRVLWLMGDSFVAASPGQTRSQSRMVRNTVAIETGYNPAHASMRFYWKTRDGAAQSFFPERGNTWLWPMHGILDHRHLLLFFSVLGADPSPQSLGFREVGSTAFLISNPEAEPSRWHMHEIASPKNDWGITLGITVLQKNNRLYLFGEDEPAHDIYLARLPLARAMTGNFSQVEWWSPQTQQWLPQQTLTHRPAPVFPHGSTEMSVQWSPKLQCYVEIESLGFGASTIAMRQSTTLEGPWSPPQTIFRPSESSAPDAFVYAGKSHPELRDADLIITYAANGSDDRVAHDMSLYFPRFVRVQLMPH